MAVALALVQTPPPTNVRIVQTGAQLIKGTVFAGAWRYSSADFPAGSGERWDYGGFGLAFDPAACANGGLFSQNNSMQIAESCIPPVSTWSTSTTIGALPVATMVQGFIPAVDNYANNSGMWAPATPGDTSLAPGDCKFWGANLFCVQHLYYDGANDQNKAIWKRSPTLSGSSFSGFVRMNPTGWSGQNSAGASSQHPVSHYLVPVPTAYASSLGPMLAGGGGGSIVSTTSLGPSAFAFNPNAFTVGADLPATALQWYDSAHPNLGVWDPRASGNAPTTPSNKPYHWTGDATATSAVIPTGKRTMLHFGRGTGNFCYGIGTSDPTKDGTIDPVTGDVYCYDTQDSSTKGTHSSDHHPQVWAYDLNDLAAVKAGTKNPYDVLPYALWDLNLPTGLGTCTGTPGVGNSDNAPIGAVLGSIGGTEYLFVSFSYADHSDGNCRPLIGAFTFQ